MAKQTNYFNDVFPEAINDNHQIENSESGKAVIKQKTKEKHFIIDYYLF